MIPGRPFRFLYCILCLWFVSRAAAWVIGMQEMDNRTASRMEKPLFPTRGRGQIRRAAPGHSIHRDIASSMSTPSPRAQKRVPRADHPNKAPLLILAGVRPNLASAAPSEAGIFNAPADGSLPPSRDMAGAKPNRWTLSAWMLYRPDHKGSRLANAGQLGASQAGARLAYDLTSSARSALAIHGRVSAALQSPSQIEGATGITFRPDRAIPIAVSMERRFNIGDGGRDAFAVYLAGGINPSPILAGLTLEGYAQAGLVGLSSTDLFADGHFSIARPLSSEEDATRITIGLAMSGGAQPSLSRLDVGPQLSARFALGNTNARLAVEWRERIAGMARPSSGPAFILAADF